MSRGGREELTTTVETPITRELAEELHAFYNTTLIPEFVCAGEGPDRPTPSWLVADGRKAVVTRDATGSILGCWVLKNSGIYYPCVDVTGGLPVVVSVLRELAYTSFESEGTALWASTTNPLIHEWAKQGRDFPMPHRPRGMPKPTFTDTRIEWK